MRSGRRARAIAALFLCVSALAACNGSDGRTATPGGDSNFVPGAGNVEIIEVAERGDPIALSGPLIDGKHLDVASLRGKIVLINIWGSWCAPCRAEAPDLQKAWDQVRTFTDVQFLGLNTRDDAAGAAEAFERRFGITYPSLRDPDGSLQLSFRSSLPPRAIPSTLLLDKQGRVAARIVGKGSRGTFTALVEQLRSES